MGDPVLVASADGVGTKLRVAFMSGIHGTIGADLVNHCVNDILVQGAQPLFFLDYLATGRLDPDVAVQIVDGLARACRENGCALLGGETAEMPGFYADGEYDVAGFIVGCGRARPADRRPAHRGRATCSIGLPSSGLHTNGYSLARTIVFERLKLGVHDRVPELGVTVAEALLAPHRSYLPVIRPLLETSPGLIKGMAHITGGGITDNLPRVLPAGTEAVVRAGIVGGAAALPLARARGRGAAGRHAAHLQHGRRPDPGRRRRATPTRRSARCAAPASPARASSARLRPRRRARAGRPLRGLIPGAGACPAHRP